MCKKPPENRRLLLRPWEGTALRFYGKYSPALPALSTPGGGIFSRVLPLPGGAEIHTTTFRGELSEGMMAVLMSCSLVFFLLVVLAVLAIYKLHPSTLAAARRRK